MGACLIFSDRHGTKLGEAIGYSSSSCLLGPIFTGLIVWLPKLLLETAVWIPVVWDIAAGFLGYLLWITGLISWGSCYRSWIWISFSYRVLIVCLSQVTAKTYAFHTPHIFCHTICLESTRIRIDLPFIHDYGSHTKNTWVDPHLIDHKALYFFSFFPFLSLFPQLYYTLEFVIHYQQNSIYI